MNLRAYQIRAIAALREKFAAGKRAPCLVLPTGGGKTVVAAEIVRSAIARGNRVLFLAHRTELLDQTVRKLSAAGVHDVRMIRAANDSGPKAAPITVASIPTLTRWAAMPPADLVVFDECHHVIAGTWAKIAQAYTGASVLGMTATPQRSDGKPLGDIFDSLVVASTVRELTDLGHLVPCRVYAPMEKLDQAQVVVSPAQAYLQRAEGQRAVVFCSTVEHAQAAAAEMNAAGIRTGVVNGSGSQAARANTLAQLAAGDLDAVCNVHVLTEGWDLPAVSVCILARKPVHAGTFLQMAGRVLRPSPGKAYATLVDLCGSVHDHGPPDLEREYTLDGKGITGAPRDAIRQCVSCGGVFVAGPAQCPMCGFEAPRREFRLPDAIGGELVDLSTLPKLPPRAYTLSITAKFPGVCRLCLGRIHAGQQIYWAKGEKPRHADCSAGRAVVV